MLSVTGSFIGAHPQYNDSLMYMSRSFQNGAFNANSTFGKNNNSATAGDHIATIKSRALFRTTYAINCDKIVKCPKKCIKDCNKIYSSKKVCCDETCKKKSGQPSDKNNSNSYDFLMSIRHGYMLDKNEIDNVPPFNQMDLVSGLYSTVDLLDVPTVCSIVDELNDKIGVNTYCVPFYQYYRVDPDGELFGNTPCSINNYLNFVVLQE
jgi:hypothetical protein